MTTVFIAGSISIGNIHPFVIERIETIIESEFNILVGDANGVDSSIQRILYERNAKNVTIYCSGERPRNNIGGWPVNNIYPNAPAKSREYFTAKDIAMASRADYGFMIWDTKSTGTLSNVIELLCKSRKSIVFINKSKEFIKLEDRDSIERLVDYMSATAKTKAEEKISLSAKISGFSNIQATLSV